MASGGYRRRLLGYTSLLQNSTYVSGGKALCSSLRQPAHVSSLLESTALRTDVPCSALLPLSSFASRAYATGRSPQQEGSEAPPNSDPAKPKLSFSQRFNQLLYGRRSQDPVIREREEKEQAERVAERAAEERKPGWLRRHLSVGKALEALLLKLHVTDDPFVARTAGRAAAVTVWGLVALSAAGTAGVDTAPLVGGLGIASLVGGLAVKDVVGNIVTSLLLAVDKPFKTGSHIRVHTSGAGVIEGKVHSVEMRYVIIKNETGTWRIPTSAFNVAPIFEAKVGPADAPKKVNEKITPSPANSSAGTVKKPNGRPKGGSA